MEQAIKTILEREFLAEDIAKDYDKNSYVKPHLVIARLNEAFGPDGWRFELSERVENAECVIQFGKIGVKDDNGEWIYKENCGVMRRQYAKEQPHEPQHEQKHNTTYKGAVSNCLKRCAMMWGIGLHLYGDPEHEGEDPRKVALENIVNGEMSLSKKLECSYTDLRNQHFGPDNDNLEKKSLEELEGYLIFLRGLRDEGEKEKAQLPDKKQSESASDNDTNGAPGDVIKLKNEASQAQAKALRDGVIKKLDADALRMKHFDSRFFPDDAAKLRAFIKEISAL